MQKIDRADVLWDPLLKASVHGHLNHTGEVAKNLKLFIQMIPDADNQVKDIIGAFLLFSLLHNEILDGLKKAGLTEKCFAIKI